MTRFPPFPAVKRRQFIWEGTFWSFLANPDVKPKEYRGLLALLAQETQEMTLILNLEHGPNPGPPRAQNGIFDNLGPVLCHQWQTMCTR